MAYIVEIHVPRHTTKAKYWKSAFVSVLFDNQADVIERQLVLIRVALPIEMK